MWWVGSYKYILCTKLIDWLILYFFFYSECFVFFVDDLSKFAFHQRIVVLIILAEYMAQRYSQQELYLILMWMIAVLHYKYQIETFFSLECEWIIYYLVMYLGFETELAGCDAFQVFMFISLALGCK